MHRFTFHIVYSLLTYNFLETLADGDSDTDENIFELDESYVYDYYNGIPVTRCFKKARIVPDLIPVAPENKCHVTFSPITVRARLGNRHRKMYLVETPEVRFAGEHNKLYTMILYHPNIPIGNMSFAEWHPWVVGNIPGPCFVNRGDTLYTYKFSVYPRDSGVQLLLCLVYEQEAYISFDPKDKHRPRTIPRFNMLKFVTKYDLGNPMYGNFMYSFD